MNERDMELSHTTNHKEGECAGNSVNSGPPHEALFLVLVYLPVFELLAMTRVCRSLRDAINNDILPWLNFIVNRPLNMKICDDILIKITSKAQGRLKTLALINCVKITDDGLQYVVEKNPLVNKLHIPGCTGLTTDGIIRAVKTLSEHNHSLTSLKINGIHNIKKEHMEALRSLIGAKVPHLQQQQFYHKHKNISSFGHEESNSSIGMDICPKCNEVRVVFDCPKETCERRKQRLFTECQGCYLCIPRCEECGICVESEELEDAACEHFLCSDCWLQLPKCNYCNKAYCNQHTNLQCSVSGSSGFICSVCQGEFLKNDHNWEEI